MRDVLYIDDLVAVYRAFLLSKQSSAVFNVGGGPRHLLSLNGLLNILESKLGKKIRVKFGPWRASDQRVYISDIRHIAKTLNWQPHVDPKSGVLRLLEWGQNWLGVATGAS